MNLDAMNLTVPQRKSIERVDGPLLLCAGAGSGKTFTLQQRIAYALSPESGPAVESIDAVMAITFTEKAAAEIKSRVRAVLRREGMFDQALAVDGAWISTIHGTAARLLRERALEIAIDPQFVVLDDAEAGLLRSQALATVLNRREGGEVVERFGGALDSLFRIFGTSDASPNSVGSLINALLDKAASLTGGLDAIGLGPVQTADPKAVARRLVLSLEELCGFNLSEKKRVSAEASLETVNAYLACEQDDGDWSCWIKALARVEKPSLAGVKDEELKEALREGQRAYARAVMDTELGRAVPLACALLDLARQVEGEYRALKDRLGALDMADQLRVALRALEEHPDIARSYRDRFQLVMVDEFQDTNQLQIDFIEKLCKPHRANLCTVGDSQQSIYRFQGAEVEVYLRHKQDMEDPGTGALSLQLDRNFRSHPDILAFVRRLCGQPGYFQEPFLDLEPGRDEERVRAAGRHFKGSGPRVAVTVTAKAVRGGATGDQARVAEAQAIAAWFSKLKDAGHSPSDMVVLMRSMTHASVYARVLRSKGFDCVVAGGSGLFQTEEVQQFGFLLNVLADPADTCALFAVLSGEMFMLEADDLLLLATRFPDEEREVPQRCSLAAKVFAEDIPEASERLRFALAVLRRGWSAAGSGDVAAAARRVLGDSGYLARLQEGGADGMARAANVAKALRLTEEIQREPGFDAARVARRFAEKAMGKEKYGTLAGDGSSSVRLMTIHASKGLEFPIVAVVGCGKVSDDSGRMELLSAPGGAYLSLMPAEPLRNDEGKPLSADGYIEKLDETLADDPAPAVEDTRPDSLAAMRAAMVRSRRWADLYEARRLLYVALTRASEAVMVCFLQDKTAAGTAKHLAGDAAWALFGDDRFPAESGSVDYGGSEPALYSYADADAIVATEDQREPSKADAGRPVGNGVCDETRLSDPAAQGDVGKNGPYVGASASQDCGQALVRYPRLPEEPPLRRIMAPAQSTGLFSYSSLAAAADHERPAGPSPEEDGGTQVQGGAEAAGLSRQGSASCAFPFPDGPAAPDRKTAVSETFGSAAAGAVFADDALLDDYGFPASVPAVPPAPFAVAYTDGVSPAPSDPSAGPAISDADKATDFGSAFHRLAQIDARHGAKRARGAVEPMAEVFALSDPARLARALERWLGSDVRAHARSFDLLEDELPFCLPCAGGFLEGEIDLLCTDGSKRAFVVDYKTGGSPEESFEALQAKHSLQASCYAWALMEAGYDAVDFAFVRVEQADPDCPDQPQVVTYAFNASQQEALESLIREASVAAL